MTVENISRSNLHERMLPTRQPCSLQPPGHQLEAHPTEPLRLAFCSVCCKCIAILDFFNKFLLVFDFQVHVEQL